MYKELALCNPIHQIYVYDFNVGSIHQGFLLVEIPDLEASQNIPISTLSVAVMETT